MILLLNFDHKVCINIPCVSNYASVGCLKQQLLSKIFNGVHAISGPRFQAARNTGEEKDVATKHEDQADCPGHHRRAHPHHNPVGVPWVQLWQVQVRTTRGRETHSTVLILLLIRAKPIYGA